MPAPVLRGSTASPPPVFGLDIETDTTTDGLDPTVAGIVAVAVSSSAGDVVFDGPEPHLLARLDAHLSGLEPGVIATWNGSGFDLPFLAYRAQRCRVRLGLDIAPDPALQLRDTGLPGFTSGCRAAWHAHGHLDAYRLYRADTVRTLAIGGGLKTIARACGLAPVEVDAARIHDLSPDEVRRYVASDARCTRLLLERRWPTAMNAVDRFPVPSRRTPPPPPVLSASPVIRPHRDPGALVSAGVTADETGSTVAPWPR